MISRHVGLKKQDKVVHKENSILSCLVRYTNMATTSLRVKTTRQWKSTLTDWLVDWVVDNLTILIFLPIALLSPGDHPPTNKVKTLDYPGYGHHLWSIERFHTRDEHLYKFIETKGSIYIRKEFNSLRICLIHQHGRRFIVLEHQYGRRDVMWKPSIVSTIIHVQSYFPFFFLQKLTILHQMLMLRSVIIADHKRE